MWKLSFSYGGGEIWSNDGSLPMELAPRSWSYHSMLYVGRCSVLGKWNMLGMGRGGGAVLTFTAYTDKGYCSMG